MVLRPYGRTAVFRAGRRARRSRRPPCRRVVRETRDDSVRVGSGVSTPGPTSTRTRVRAVHYLNDEPQSGTPCRMGPQSREGLHSVLIFMRRFWQQFTHGGNFKQNSGCEWISATNQFCPKPDLAIVGKKCCGLRQSGVSARSQSRNYFEETPFAQANGVSARGRKKANLPGNLLVA